MRVAIVVVFVSCVAHVACKKQIAGGEADGAAIFADACAQCHGPTGKPDPAMAASLGAKDLSSAEFRERATPEGVRRQIVDGSDNRVMPPFGKQLSAAQLDALVEYVLSLSAP